MFRFCKRLRNMLEIPMLSEVTGNKVFNLKDNPIFVSSVLYFVPTLRLFWPPA